MPRDVLWSSRRTQVIPSSHARPSRSPWTGSSDGGRALFDLAVSRPDPIPFYGELGSTNPVVVTRAGWAERAQEIVEGFTASFTLGSGQFCTKPGVVLVPDIEAFAARLDLPPVGRLLGDRIQSGYAKGLDELTTRPGVRELARGTVAEGPAAVVVGTTVAAVLDDPSIVTTEVFGPVSVLVEYGTVDAAERTLDLIGGVLTATVQGGSVPDDDALHLIEAMSEHAGRVIWNGWPTGVTVTDAQQHGGPWPATTAPTTTSVGTAAVLRFARPIAFQGVPDEALPPELRDGY